MGTRKISLVEDAYERLLGLKKPDESFSDLVRRLSRRSSPLELTGILPQPRGTKG